MAGTLFKRDVELQTGKKWEDWIKQGEGGWEIIRDTTVLS